MKDKACQLSENNVLSLFLFFLFVGRTLQSSCPHLLLEHLPPSPAHLAAVICIFPSNSNSANLGKSKVAIHQEKTRQVATESVLVAKKET